MVENCRNKIVPMNTWAVSQMRYGAGFAKWTKRIKEQTW